jgi:hypothetical protein
MIPAIEAERIPLERAGKVIKSGRKTPEIDVKWKQYSGRSPGKSTRKMSEVTGKKSENFWLEYCFDVPLISSVFLQEPVRTC